LGVHHFKADNFIYDDWDPYHLANKSKVVQTFYVA